MKTILEKDGKEVGGIYMGFLVKKSTTTIEIVNPCKELMNALPIGKELMVSSTSEKCTVVSKTKTTVTIDKNIAIGDGEIMMFE